MNANSVIENAVKFILGEQDFVTPELQEDCYFLGDTIIRIAETLARDGAPTIDTLNQSIEIGELTAADCRNGHNTLRTSDQHGRRTADTLCSLAYHCRLANNEVALPVDIHGQTYALDVCQAFPAFMAGIHKVHSAEITVEHINERAKAYWLAVFGFWA